ncbi:glycosyltransferase family 2 protein [Chloroflexota bacterium]
MDTSSEQKIIVGMPAYNEEKYIGSIILQARQYADEVIVIDDGSTDHTSSIANLAGATVIKHTENKGKGAAIQRILTESRDREADILVLLDADSQHDPEEIPYLIKAVSEGYDLVIGSRKTRRDVIPYYRKIGQRVLSFFTRTLSRTKVLDTESGFRALSRKAISEIKLRESGFAIETEMIASAAARGLNITEVPISIIYTQDGSTLNPISHGFGVLNRIISMISNRRPLLFFGSFGSICIVLGLIMGIAVVRVLFASDVLATGSALLSMLLITIGMLSVFTGIILDVLVKRIKG